MPVTVLVATYTYIALLALTRGSRTACMQKGNAVIGLVGCCFTSSYTHSVALPCRVRHTQGVYFPYLCLLDVHSKQGYIAGLQGRVKDLCKVQLESTKKYHNHENIKMVQWDILLIPHQKFLHKGAGDLFFPALVGFDISSKACLA